MGGIDVLTRPLDHPSGRELYYVEPEAYRVSNISTDIAIMVAIHQHLHDIIHARNRFVKEATFSKFAQSLASAIVRTGSSSSVKPTCIETQVSIDASVLRMLELPGFIASTPDWAIGLTEATVLPCRDPSSPPIATVLSDYLLSRSVDILWSPTDSLASDAWWPWIVIEDRSGRGSIDKARLQSYTAMRTALGIYLRLYDQAARADPVNCMVLDDTMRRVYALRTVSNVWEIDVMVEQEGKYLTLTLWSGSVTEPAGIAQVSGILQGLNSEYDRRNMMISNWLFCLRDLTLDPKKAVERFMAKASGSSGKKSKPTKTQPKPYDRPKAGSKGKDKASDRQVTQAVILSWLDGIH
ncbi:hypothetical protein V865_005051 [Kwoniella europaea PYCC6329]|uniref:Fungal-type protein kinase domain-containing protein n=1 Tax=Kwoniella europaea PYCC6329 TaxID=1423913 RepID=A0AAX4KLR9_9TREE